MTKRAIVIGAGISGLATAALLGKEGYAVTLLEKNASLGGRAMVWEKDGFRFDMGPSWYQVPAAFDHFFARFGKKTSDYYELIKLDPQYQVFFGESARYDISPDLEKNLALFESLEAGAGEKVKRYLAEAKEQYDISMKHLLYRNLESFADYMNPQIGMQAAKMKILQRLDAYAGQFTKNDIIKKLLTYSTLFVGGDPRKTPALFSLMSYVDFGIGTYYPMGGISIFIDALKQLCEEQSVEIKTSEPVVSIDVEAGTARSVTTTTARYEADVVISTADYPFTELALLKPDWRSYNESYWKGSTFSPSAFVGYLGINKRLKKLCHHNLFIADQWHDHFDSLFKTKTLPTDPSFYVSCTSRTDPSVAPQDCENLFFAVQVPGGNPPSQEEQAAFKELVLDRIEHLAGEPFRENIIIERYAGFGDFGSFFNARDNAAIGLAMTFKQSMFRPSSKSKKVSNLFYAGQYVSPGVGMPMCLISAEKAFERIVGYN